MKAGSSFLVLCLFTVLLIGCGGSQGQFRQSTGTAIKLSEKNYRVIKAGATGSSTGFYLFGFIPIISPTFADAKAELYQSAGQALEGRAIALANQTEDTSQLYLILFSMPKIILTADIVEFTDKSEKSSE